MKMKNKKNMFSWVVKIALIFLGGVACVAYFFFYESALGKILAKYSFYIILAIVGLVIVFSKSDKKS